MKKTLAILLTALLGVSLLASCTTKWDGSASAPGGGYAGFSGERAYTEDAVMSSPAAMPPQNAPRPEPDMAMEEMGKEFYAYENAEMNAGMPELTKIAADMSEKIIYTVSADIETVTFDDTIEKVYAMTSGFGAFIENSHEGGKNYWQRESGYQTYRTAWFTLRVPISALSAMTEQLSELGSVTGINRSAENITSQFIDTESRLKSYRTQEERLLAMMEKAETVEDMLAIEGYLADVRYQIEAMTSQLTNWQSRVDYSTLTLNIYEVEKYSELPPELPVTYWQQVKSGFASTLRGIGEFFLGLFKWLIWSLPVLVILAVIVVVILVILTRRGRAAKRTYTDTTPPENKEP